MQTEMLSQLVGAGSGLPSTVHFQHIGVRETAHPVALALVRGAMLLLVVVVFSVRSPTQVGVSVITGNAIAMCNLVFRRRLRAVKSFANERMHHHGLLPPAIVKRHIAVAEFSRPGLKDLARASAGSSCAGTTHAPAVRDLIWPAGYIAPVLVLFALSVGSAHATMFPSKYDREIKAAVILYWPDYPFWTSYKSQLYQESRLDPAAVSPVGARGLAQFMPATWTDVSKAMGLGLMSPHVVGPAIEAGAFYMRSLRRSWSAPRPLEDRQKLAQASYNAGMGNLLKAQRECGGSNLYAEIIACLPLVTGRHSRETITYVERIARWRRMMEAGL